MEINHLAAVVAALSSFLLGGLWYSPMLFLKPVLKAMGRDEHSDQGHPARVFMLSFGINYQFANRPISALFIDGGNHSVQFILYALILGLWH